MAAPKKSDKDSEKSSVSETLYESSEVKAPKPKKESRAAVKKKAEAIIAKQKARKNRQPGSLVGGEPEIYHYYWIPNHEPQYTTMMVKLTDLGYEVEPDKEVHFHGVLGGTVLRVPVEVKEHMREERAKKHGHSLKRR